MTENDNIELDATKAAQSLGLSKIRDLRKAKLSFVVRGNTLNGAEVKTEMQLSIQHIKFNILKFKRKR